MSRSTRPSDTMSRNQYPRPLSPILNELGQRRPTSPILRETLPTYRRDQQEPARVMSQYEKGGAERPFHRRLIDNPTPLFVKRPYTGSIFTRNSVGPRVAQTTRALAEKTSTTNYEDEPEAPLNKPRSFSRAERREKWIQSILYSEKATAEEITETKPQQVVNQHQTLPHQLAQYQEPDYYEQPIQHDFIASIEADEPYLAEEHTPPSMSRKSRENAYIENPVPQPSIPAQNTWGSRARRPSPTWMRKILSPDDPLDKFSPPSSDTEKQFSASLLPSVDILSTQEPTPPSSRPASAQPTPHHDQTEIDDAHDPYNSDTDFTSTSIYTSPMLRIKNTKLDDLREQEIYSLAEQDEDLVDISAEQSAELPLANERGRSRSPSPTLTEERGSSPRTPSNALAVKKQRPKTPLHLYHNRVYQGIVLTDTPSPSSSPKEDSIETLRKLSRCLSKSPGPVNRRHLRDEEGDEDIDPEERITAEARLFDIQDNKSEPSHKSRSVSPKDGSHDDPKSKLSSLPTTKMPEPSTEKIAPSDRDQNFPTPKNLIGEYIDTPMPVIRKHIAHRRSQSLSSPDLEIMYVVGDRPSSSDGIKSPTNTLHARPSSSDGIQPLENRVQRTTKRPSAPLINTAKLTTAAEDVAEIQRQVESEIPSVEDLDSLFGLESGAFAGLPKRQKLKKEKDSTIIPQTERERMIEQQCIDRMNRALKRTSSTIRDATHGLERLEQQVSALPDSGGIQAPLAGERESVTVQQQKLEQLSETNVQQPMLKIKVDIQIPHPNFRYWKMLMFILFMVFALMVYTVWEIMRGPIVSMGPNDWWLGKPGPVGITKGINNSNMGMLYDEVVD